MSGSYPPQGPGYGGPDGPPTGPEYGGNQQYGNQQYGGDQQYGGGQQPGDQYGNQPYGGDQYGGGQYGAQGGYNQPPGGFEDGSGLGSANPVSQASAPQSAASANFPMYGTPGTQMGTGMTPPPKKGNGLLIGGIITGAAVVVIAAIVIGVVLTRGGAGKNTPTAAVQGYFDAIIAGDAETALGYAKVDPTDKTFLTNDMLSKSNQAAPITNVVVAETDDSAFSVPVSYQIGERRINTEIRVEEIGKDWKLTAVASELRIRQQGITPLINGVEAKTEKIFLFPGTYTMSTGNKYVDFAKDKATITIDEPSEYGGTSFSGEPVLSQEGVDLMLQAAQKSLDACMAKKELKPEGCPFYANPNTENGAITLDMSTLKYTAQGNQFDDAKPRLDYENPLIAQFSFYPNIKYYVKGTRADGSGGEYNYRVSPSDTRRAQMDFSADEPTFSWV